MTPDAVGNRVRYWRKRRGLTRREFAERCARSVTWVDKVESGERRLVRLPMLQQVASVLGISVETLTDPADVARSDQAAEVAAIATALADYSPLLQPVPGRLDLDELEHRLAHVHAAWLASDFPQVARHLPALMLDAQRAAGSLDADPVRTARLLVDVYRTASSTLMKLDAHETAWLAADRALAVAHRSGDPFCLARAARATARALTEIGRTAEAFALLSTVLDQLRPQTPGKDNQLAAPFGMLLLAAENAAADLGDAHAADLLHSEANQVAHTWFGTRHDANTAFGPANVALHRVSALVRLERFTQALEVADDFPAEQLALLPRERRASLLLDQAAAHRHLNHRQQAIDLLLAAEHTAPEEVRSRPSTRSLIADLVHDPTATLTPDLRGLAQRAGVQT